jgi:hypothetical protein
MSSTEAFTVPAEFPAIETVPVPDQSKPTIASNKVVPRGLAVIDLAETTLSPQCPGTITVLLYA